MDKKLRGKKSRAAGNRFELKVRADLESKGWICDKWTNNVEFEIYTEEGKIDKRKKIPLIEMIPKVSPYGIHGEEFEKKKSIDTKYLFSVGKKGKLVKAKAKWIPGRPMMLGAGFPDFIAFKNDVNNFRKPIPFIGLETLIIDRDFRTIIIAVESKMDGKLDKTEKEKAKWLLDNHIFSKILIASKDEKRGQIKYTEFKNEK